MRKVIKCPRAKIYDELKMSTNTVETALIKTLETTFVSYNFLFDVAVNH